MTESNQVTLLRRMTRPRGQVVTENPLTTSRAVRLALTKAANDTVGLVLTVESVGEEIAPLDEMLGALGHDLMLVALERDKAVIGLMALDMELRAAVLEMQTMGAVLAQRADERAPTRTDKMLCDPFLATFLTAFPGAVSGTPLEGWVDAVTLGDRVDSTRAAGLVLEDRAYRIVRLSVDLGVAERQAELVICLPLVEQIKPVDTAPVVNVDWGSMFEENVSNSPARLDALLHRFPLSLATAQSLQVGTVLNLPGCTVNSVRLLSPDKKVVAHAKLGQLGGYRAVRIETAPAPQLAELPSAPRDVPMPDTLGLALADDALDLIDDDPLPLQDPTDPFGDDMMSEGLPDMADIAFDPDTP